jgi:sialate O-acetylesterase
MWQKNNYKLMKKLLFIGIVLIQTLLLNAQLRIAGVFGNNAVIQQNSAVPVWGKAAPNAEVVVEFAGQKNTAVANESGAWMLRLQPLKADGKSYTLSIISGSEKISFTNLKIGEVWLASGQSNMQWKISNVVLNQEQEIQNANFRDIRFNTIEPVTSAQPLSDIPQKDWKICTPQNVPDFSAVAYFFARELHLDKKVPVGIIVAARGATNLETWISQERLMTHPDFTDVVKNADTDTTRWNAFVRKSHQLEKDRETIANTSLSGIRQKVHTIKYIDNDWVKTAYPLHMAKMGYPGFWGLIWLRKTFEISESVSSQTWKLILPIKDQNDRIFINGKEIAQGVSKLHDKTVNIPKGLLKKGRNVLAIRMYVHWGSAEIGNPETATYLQSNKNQRIELAGEWTHSNKIEPAVAQWQNYYNTNNVNFNAMIAPVIPYGIRGFLWYQGENNAGRFKQYAELQPLLIDDWRVLWQQGYLPFLFVQLANYKERSAESVDKDDWAAFRDAQTSTLQRSQNTAMASAIDIGDGNDIHPKNKQEVGKRLYLAARAKAYNENIIYSGPQFKSVKKEGNNLRISFDYAQNGLKTNQNQAVKGFAVCDKSGKWSWANAKIAGNEIIIENAGIALRVQYAWQSNPECNLQNAEGLPAVPFNVEIDPKPLGH